MKDVITPDSTLTNPSITESDGAAPIGRRGNMLQRLWRSIDALKREFAKFGVVGAVTYCLDTALLSLLLFSIGEPITSKIIAALVAGTAAFLGNRYWTWRDRSRSGLGREYLLYAVANIAGIGLQVACLGVSHYGLGAVWPEVFQAKLADVVSANVIGMVFGTLFRFWAYRTYVFREDSE